MLSLCFRHIFAIPAQSADSERVFSQLTKIVNNQRITLNEQRAGMNVKSAFRHKQYLKAEELHLEKRIVFPIFGEISCDNVDWDVIALDDDFDYIPDGTEEESDYDPDDYEEELEEFIADVAYPLRINILGNTVTSSNLLSPIENITSLSSTRAATNASSSSNSSIAIGTQPANTNNSNTTVRRRHLTHK
jgi:hypothetical protein